jgi:hypothetical protein
MSAIFSSVPLAVMVVGEVDPLLQHPVGQASDFVILGILYDVKTSIIKVHRTLPRSIRF